MARPAIANRPAGQATAEALLATAILVVALWAVSRDGEGALASFWQAWSLHWQRFAAALALPI